VVDNWNGRVQVFDSAGQYLTTLGGQWGTDSGEMRNPLGVALDSSGNVYVSDECNYRVEMYARGVPGWAQSNLNGFGEPSNELVTALGEFGGDLYAGTYNPGGTGAQIWRLEGGAWTETVPDGFGNSANAAIDDLIEFGGKLYAGTWADETNGGEVWRSDYGSSWSQVVSKGFGDPTNGEVFRLASFGGQLYASTCSYSPSHGVEIWRSSTGDAGSWSQVVNNGFDSDPSNEVTPGLEAFNGYLYAGTLRTSGGGQVWRSADGTSWLQVNTDGFGDPDNGMIAALAPFGGKLYAASGNDATGGQIWRCSTCDGTDWTKVVGDGFGSPATNVEVESLQVSGNRLYAVTQVPAWRATTGMEVWSSLTGNPGDWEPEAQHGFGDSNNWGPYWGSSVTSYNGTLYVGTWNYGNGGEIWERLHEVLLPLTVRNYP
jgi:hypothetical protein